MKRILAVLTTVVVCMTLAACSNGESQEVKDYRDSAAVSYFIDGSAFDDLLTMAQAEGDADKAREAGTRIATKMGELSEVQSPESCIEAQTSLVKASDSIGKAATCYYKCAELYQNAMIDLDTNSLTEYNSLLKDAGNSQEEAIKLVEQAKSELS